MLDEKELLHPEPLWTEFRTWAKQRWGDRPDFGSRLSDAVPFAYYPSSERQAYVDKVLFKSIEDIPPCIKYRRAAAIQFVQAEKQYCGQILKPIVASTYSLIHLDTEQFRDFHPVRYDKVKEALARGVIDMPRIDCDEEGEVSVGDGRHRIVALHKLGIDSIRVVIPVEREDYIVSKLLRDNIT